MKKTIILLLAASALTCACTKETQSTSEASEIEFTVGAQINAPISKTAFVPESNKVVWLSGDKLGLKYTKTAASNAKYDNISLSLVSGQNTGIATFSGKLSSTSAIPDGAVLVFYYPYISTVAKTGTVTDKDNITIGGNFPKVQNTNDILFDPNLMYGLVTNTGEVISTSEATIPVEVTMKNVMSVIDFTFKGAGSIKRVFVTDLNTGAKGMTGDYTVSIKNGVFEGFASLPAGEKEYDRTIIADLPKPVALTAEGAHVYVTVMPRSYSAGIKVGIELTTGDYMTKTISTPFTTEPSKAYTAPALTFSAQTAEGKGIYENTIYSYQTFTDARDNNIYRYATLADGKDWMIQNLRYIPEGLTPSSNASDANCGIWYPVTVNENGTGAAFNTSAEAVAQFGYLYNISVALDQDPEYIHDLQKCVEVSKEVSADDALAELIGLDNKGICPAGWHIPTQAEYDNLYSKSGSSMSGLGVQGFSLKDFGYLNVGTVSATSDPATGTISGWTTNKINMAYMLLSTPNSHKQYKAIMTNVSNNTAATSNLNARSGVPVRCIK